MTLEEAKHKIVDMYFKSTEYYGQDFEVFIENIYDAFEQRIKDLEEEVQGYIENQAGEDI